jgi:hypothetical protein
MVIKKNIVKITVRNKKDCSVLTNKSDSYNFFYPIAMKSQEKKYISK